MESVYKSKTTVDELIEYIMSKKEEINSERMKKEAGLSDIIKNYGTVHCGIRNDKVDDLVKGLVRDKSIKTIDELNNRINNEIVPRVRDYIRWSFYNQVTNDLIEHFFINHPKVIPTLRKIHDIDFFIRTDTGIIPFDLKITHIADDCFDIISKKPIAAQGSDSFTVPDTQSEGEMLKDFYKSVKKEYDLPNLSKQTKPEILENLSLVGNSDVEKFVKKMISNRNEVVSKLAENLKLVEWWNYKYQGERLFCNNNRLFIFLAYYNSFEDGRPIKGELELIQQRVKAMLDAFSEKDIHIINYHYDKDPALVGDYTVQSTSLLVTKQL